MDQNLISLAFAAGLVAALNPCGFAMLPGYLVLAVRGEAANDRRDSSPMTTVGRALGATAGMGLGFVAVFGLFGALSISAGTVVQRYVPYVTVVIGTALVALGAWLLSGRELRLLAPRHLGGTPTARLGSMFGYGVSYAIASLSCTVGPFLAVTAAGLRGGSVIGSVSIYLAYVGGLVLVVGVLAVAAATASSAVVNRLRRILPYVNRIGGALLLLVGLYVGYYGVYELRLLSGRAPPDSVLAGVGRLQGAAAGWVRESGGWPLAVALVLLLLCAVVVTWRRRASRSH